MFNFFNKLSVWENEINYYFSIWKYKQVQRKII